MKISFLLALVFIGVTTVYAKDWRGISPLHYTREDVERILGKSKGGPNDSFIATYETEDETIVISYAWSKCEKDSDESKGYFYQ